MRGVETLSARKRGDLPARAARFGLRQDGLLELQGETAAANNRRNLGVRALVTRRSGTEIVLVAFEAEQGLRVSFPPSVYTNLGKGNGLTLC